MQERNDIDISAVPESPRYLYTVDYIFPSKFSTVAAFEKKDVEVGFHVQEFYEICIISSGIGYHIIEDTCVKAVIGDVFVVPPGRKHAFIGGNGFDVYYIHLSPRFLEQNLMKLKNLPSFFTLFEIEPLMRANGTKYRHLYLEHNALVEILSILKVVEKEWQGNEFQHLTQESYIIIALTILCREYEKLQTIIGKNANIDKHFMSSVSVILEDYNKKLTIEHLAKIARLSRTTYIERFRKNMGTSPRHFIMMQRLKAAKKRLATTDTPIIKIAEETGFYDSAHFCKCFVAFEKMSPSEYRASQQKL